MYLDNKGRFTTARQSPARFLLCLVFSILMTSPVLAARAMKPLEIKQRYTQVLEVLATGALDQALADLVGFELAAVGDQQAWRYVDNLWRSKLHVIRDLLATQDAGLLLPIIVLHHDAYFRYAEMDRNYLAQHSRTMAAELAEILAQRSTAPGANSFAGWTLTSFAAYLWSPSNIGESAGLFYRASLLDPGNELASQGLAAAWERSGSYEKAIASLTTALKLRPDDPELLLRLSLCHLRYPDGSYEKALTQLSSLTRSEAPAWIRSVASQELARAQLAGDDASTAEATLREGLQELPGDQQLSLQLASILDGQRRRSEAMAVLEAIEIYGWDRESARQTYDFWEPPDISEIRAELHREMEAGVEILRSGLTDTAATGGGS